MENNNIRTMNYLGEDDWGNQVFRCEETNVLYKNIGTDIENYDLCSCGNRFDGEPCYPIKNDLEIRFAGIDNLPTRAEKHNYMMLSRLQSDCKYYLGYGNRYAGHLWAKDEKEQIEEMKRLYNSFTTDKKPEWLTYKDILNYEKQMITDNI